MKSKVEEQQFVDDVVLPEQLLPKLKKYFSDQIKEEAEDLDFKDSLSTSKAAPIFYGPSFPFLFNNMAPT